MASIIKVDNLGKKYLLNNSTRPHVFSLREDITHFWSNITKRSWRRVENSLMNDFWALRNVSFDIQEGERVGVLGRNGAGKSTLLKLISRITAPSEGRITLRGRVLSLLEIGTGFHRELSGQENIFLSGAILGMSRIEIREKLDEIISFSEIEHFLNVPVKQYSSGMYFRLAFAVASHLSTEILVIDEALAVGDSIFQKKCLARMDQICGSGTTMLVVSHDINVIERLCSRVLILNKGTLASEQIFSGPGSFAQSYNNVIGDHS